MKNKSEKGFFAAFLGANYLNTLLNVLFNVFLINMLSTSDFGRLSIGKAIFQSFDLSHLGIRNSFDRLIPTKYSVQSKLKIFSIGLFFTTMTSLLLAVYWIFKEGVFYVYFIIGGILYSIITLYKVYYRSENKKEFVKLSILALLVPTIFQIIFFLIGGINYLFFSYLFAYAILIIVILKRFSVNILFGIKRKLFIVKYMLSRGFFIYLSGLLFFISSFVDRFFIADICGLDVVGKFSVIIFFFSVFTLFATSYNEMIMSKIIVSKSIRFVLKHSLILGLGVTGISIVCYFILPFAVEVFMPKYLEEVDAMRVMMFAALPFSIKSLINSYFHSIDKRTVLFIIELASTVIYFLLLFYILDTSKELINIVYAKVFYFFMSIFVAGIYITYYVKSQKR